MRTGMRVFASSLAILFFILSTISRTTATYEIPAAAQEQKQTTTTVASNKYGEGGTVETNSGEKLEILSEDWRDKGGNLREHHFLVYSRPPKVVKVVNEGWAFYRGDAAKTRWEVYARPHEGPLPNGDFGPDGTWDLAFLSSPVKVETLRGISKEEMDKAIEGIEQWAKDGTIPKFAKQPPKPEEKPKQETGTGVKENQSGNAAPTKKKDDAPKADSNFIPDIKGDIGPGSKEEKPSAPKESTAPSKQPEPKPSPPSNTIPSSTAPGYEIKSETSSALDTVSFTTPQGKLRVNFTDDLAAGDTISATIEGEPAGRNESERAQNQSALNAYVVEVDRQQTSVREKWFTRHLPESLTVADRVIRLLENGREVARTELPIYSQGEPTPTTFTIPTGAQQGKLIEIKGPFDGVLANTDYVKIGDTIVPVLAESPRRRVVRDTSEAIGPTKIECNENARVTECPFRNLGIKLSAGKLSLLKGETTTLTVVVLGLGGLSEDVPLNLVNHSPEVIGLAGGNDQSLIIRSGETSSDGTYSIERTLTGIKAGGFNITATVRWTSVCAQPKTLAKGDGAQPGKII